MSLKNLGLYRGPIVRTLFVIFIYVLESLLLVFLCLKFPHQQDSNPKVAETILHQQVLNPKVVDSIKYFCAHFEVWNYCAQFKNKFDCFPLHSIPLLLQPLFLDLQHAQTCYHG